MENKQGCGCGKKSNPQSPATPQVNDSAPQLPVPGTPIPAPNVGYMPYPVRGGIMAQPGRQVRVQPELVTDKPKEPAKFQERQVESANTLKEQLGKKIGMVQSFASSITSRGLSNNKINKPIKQLRVLSCFGNQQQGGELPPCEYLKNSTVLPGKHFCGGCGCGDKPHTWLVADGEQYSKLDYPRLSCPLKMPGFTNYEASKPEEAGPPPTRRHYIENINYSEIEKIPVTLPEMEKPPTST